MIAPRPCLHCELTDLAQRFTDEHQLSINEVALHVTEVLAEIIAGVGSRGGRRQMIQEADKELRRLTTKHVEQRRIAGVPPY